MSRVTGQPGSRARRVVAGVVTAALLLLQAVLLSTWQPAVAAVPAGFSEQVVFTGLVNPTSVKFAPDGRVFVAEKRGTVQMFDSVADTSPTRVADLRTEVHNFWDRGLLGLALDPAFTTGRPYLYVLYTYDGPVGGTAPRWGTAGADSDPCPSPPGATADGCVVSGKLAKLTLTGTSTSKQDLIHDWCQQYPSHSIGDVVFGRDGALYVSGGDGASFNFVDYGQDGNPVNPCGDPPGGVGSTLTAPTAQGGALRSQDLRTGGDPTGLDGTIIRVHPDTGAALPDNPAAGAADANTRRIIASGLRNPFRMTQRPGTDEVWVGDVGWSTWEEVNRVVAPTAGVTNFGWPCYEGNDRQSAYDAANLTVCEDLYAQGTADTKPYFPYRHRQSINAGDNCNATSGSSTAGLSFSFYTGGPYPAEYDGALFFADYSRDCIWVMTKGTDGLPDRIKAKPFVQSAASPVDLELSPSGELFYAGFDDGTIRRIVHQGSGAVTCAANQYKAEYFANTTLTGSPASTTCEGAPLAHDFGTGAPSGVGPDGFSARWSGSFDFTAGSHTFTAVTDDGMRVWVDGVLLIDQWRGQSATTYTATRTLTAGRHDVRVEWYDSTGQAVARLGWAASGPVNAPPQAQIATPAAGTTWRVGDTISFSGSATDAEDGTLPASGLAWDVVLQHCPGGTGCHDHPLQSFAGATGSFTAPDHEYPSRLLLRLTATDSRGASDVETLVLEPRTATITVASQPAGLQLTVGQQTATAPFTTTVVLGGTASLSAPSPQTLSGTSYAFESWSDGGGQSHNITAGATSQTVTATFAPAPGGTRTVTVDAEADTMVRQDLPTTRYGTASTLSVDTEAVNGNAASRALAYLRFTVPALGAGESVTGAALSLNVTDATTNGPAIWRTGTAWTETTMSYGSGQPARTGTAPVGNFVGMGTGRVSTPVAGVTGGTVSFQLSPEITDAVYFSSRETSTRPQLLLTVATGGTPTDTTPPPAPTVSPASGTYASAPTVTASSTEAGVTHRYTVGTGTTVPPDPTTASAVLPDGGLLVDQSSVVKVASFDGAGNRSPVVRRDYTIATGATRTLTLNATADTMVSQGSPTTTHGAATTLNVDSEVTTGNASTRASAYLRFTIPTLAAGETITGAALSLDVTNATTNGPAVWRTGTTWSESTMTWNTGQPARSGTAAVGNFGSLATGRRSTPVSGITGTGTVSFQLYADSTDGVQLSSRETTSDPQLVLTIRTS